MPVDEVVPVPESGRDNAFVIVESSPLLSEKPIAIPATAATPSNALAGPSHLMGSAPHLTALPSRLVEKRLDEQLKRLAAKPGVYFFRDSRGQVLYVGKAKSLRPRVR